MRGPVIIQVYGCKACYAGPSARFKSGIDTHTGVDVRPAGVAEEDFTSPVFAAADGWIERMVPYWRSFGGIGNTIILRHSNGKFSLYGHLDAFEAGLSPGAFVPRGGRLGLMGNSGVHPRAHTITHVHFEIKEAADLGNAPGQQAYIGYTPGNPDLYSYEDPRAEIESIAADSIAPVGVRALAPGPLPVRSAPGESYVPGVPTAITDHIEAGLVFVAFRHAFVEGRDWYFIHLPSANPPLIGSHYPNNGPAGGWVDGNLVELDAMIPQLRIQAKRVLVREGPRRRTPPIARVYVGGRFAVSGSRISRRGCRAPWFSIDLPESTGARAGWICGDLADLK